MIPDAARVFSGTGRDGVHADVERSKLKGEVAAGGLQRRLDRPHHIVIGDHPVGADIAHREHRPPIGHQGCGELRHAHERVAGNVHGPGEAGSRTIEQSALKVVFRREGDRVNEAVELSPAGADQRKQFLQLAGVFDIERSGDLGAQSLRERLDVRTGLVVEPCHGKVGAGLPEGGRAAVSDRMLVRDADDQRLVPLEDRIDGFAHRGAASVGRPCCRQRAWFSVRKPFRSWRGAACPPQRGRPEASARLPINSRMDERSLALRGNSFGSAASARFSSSCSNARWSIKMALSSDGARRLPAGCWL